MQDIESSLARIVDELATLVAAYGLDVLGGIAILIVGWILSGWAGRATERALGKVAVVDATLRRFFASLVKYVALTFTVLAVLAQFGVQTAGLIAIFGAAGLAVGLALQGTLSNVAAGVMLLIFRPFKVGQYVEAGGHAGTVRSLGLFVTHMTTPDNVQIIIPNGKIWGASVVNYSANPTRRLDFLIGIAYEADIDQAISVIRTVIDGDDRCHADPEPMVVVGELADSAVKLVIRIWCDSGDYWPLKFDLTKRFKEALDAVAISIPYPQRTVHMVAEQAAE